MRCQAVGPSHARIAIVGEAPGEKEELEGLPFIGSSGQELDRMLADAGIVRDQCYVTNSVQDRPPNNDLTLWINKTKTKREGEILFRNRWVRPNVAYDITELHRALTNLKPAVVIALGNTALWALTPHQSVDKWRGSVLQSNVEGLGATIVPTYHPAGILRNYPWRQIAVNDLKRARRAVQGVTKPERRFIVAPTYKQVIATIAYLRWLCDKGPTTVICDLEIKRGEIVCAGLGWSRFDAICIPFYKETGRYFTLEESTTIWWELLLLFAHPNCELSNQNISFDIQFMFEKAGVWPKAAFDTMIAQSVLFPGTPKSLDYLASMYCDYYVYWKDDGKFWDKPIIFPQLWDYNCLDCVYTYEVQEHQEQALEELGLVAPMAQQIRTLNHILTVMFRGVRVSADRKAALQREINSLILNLTREAEFLAGMELTGDKGGISNKKLQTLFYERLAVPVIRNRKTGQPTLDDDTLASIAKKEPLFAPLVTRLNYIRSYGTAADVCGKRTDRDGRWRCSYNVAGAETFRFSSSENPFGSGLNLQNLTIGKEITK